MSTIQQRSCQTDRIITDAGLRGVRTIDYARFIDDQKRDLNNLKELLQRNNLPEASAIIALQANIAATELQAERWIRSIGGDIKKSYAITILIEEIS